MKKSPTDIPDSAATLRYVLITPARNEEVYLEKTIESVLAQTTLPHRWVIVSDGSTDRTDEIAASHAERHDFIVFSRIEASTPRSFSSKTNAFRHGYEILRHLAFDVIGVLDADVIVAPDYYACMLDAFAREPNLGACGAVHWDHVGDRLVRSLLRSHDAVGPAQMLRRQCYESIGGYLDLELGGEDTVAAVMARMAGWQTRSLLEPKVIHQRLRGTARDVGLIRARFRQGACDYHCGSDPIFFLAKALRRVNETPRILGSIAMLAGYATSWLRRAKRDVPEDVIRFLRREQIGRLRHYLRYKGGDRGIPYGSPPFPRSAGDADGRGGTL